MHKLTVLFEILAIVVSFSEAQQHCATACQRGPPTPVRCVRDGSICRKISQCSLNGENCSRRKNGRPPLTPINISRCRNIRFPSDRGLCAPVRIPRNTPRCRSNSLRCVVQSRRRFCYRSIKNNCRLITACHAKQLNCVRGPNNALTRIHARACQGLKPRDGKRQCRPVPKILPLP
ncbi:uncharacterized protein ACRADG_006680 [Cochliomyia hominivorax]